MCVAHKISHMVFPHKFEFKLVQYVEPMIANNLKALPTVITTLSQATWYRYSLQPLLVPVGYSTSTCQVRYRTVHVGPCNFHRDQLETTGINTRLAD
jgi:hypothetical protein